MDPKMMADSNFRDFNLYTEILAAPSGKFKIQNISVICSHHIEFDLKLDIT